MTQIVRNIPGNINSGLKAANSPSESNPFATIADTASPAPTGGTVEFDTTDPNMVGTIFTPNTPEDPDILYYSTNASTPGATWIWNGSSYETKSQTPNIYNASGVLTGPRVVTMGGNGLTFTGGQITIHGSGSTSATKSLLVETSASLPVFMVRDDALVGVGTVTPTSKLHIKGSGTTSGTTALRVENNSAVHGFSVKDDGMGTFSVANANGAKFVQFCPLQGGTSLVPTQFSLTLKETNANGQGYGFDIIDNSTTYANNLTMYKGRVGIGKIEPAYLLDMVNSSGHTQCVMSGVNSAITNYIASADTGLNCLAIMRASGTASGLNSWGLGSDNGLVTFCGDGGSQTGVLFGSRNAVPIIFAQSSVETARFSSTGNLGIATGATVSARLHVKGSGTTSGTTSLLVQNSSASEALRVRDDNHVIIGGSTTDIGLEIKGAGVGSAIRSYVASSSGFIKLVSISDFRIGDATMLSASKGYWMDLNTNFQLTWTGGFSNGTRTFVTTNGTAPTNNITDGFQMYSADQVAGNAAPHFRTELGDIVKLFKGAALTTSDGTLANAVTRIGEIEARLQALGLIA